MDLLIPFANTGDKEVFDETTSPTGDLSLEKGFTTLFELKPEEGGLFILRKKFNQILNLISAYVISWRKQTFPDWIADAGSGIPYAYPMEAIVRFTDGNVYISTVTDNIEVPGVGTNWKLFSDYASININGLTDKAIPADTDNFVIQETGGLLKKLSFGNLKNALINVLNFPVGTIIQVQNYTTGTMATGTAVIPWDNTIPQITEGTQFMSLAFTPKKATSKLKITVNVAMLSCNASSWTTIALFKDSNVNAIGSCVGYMLASESITPSFVAYVDAVDTSAHTFTVRIGSHASATITFNGYASAQYLGGSLASAITIEEIAQ